MVTMNGETGRRRRGQDDQHKQVYLSFSKKDIRDDVRETATQHQHHTLLAVCYTRHLGTGGTLYSVFPKFTSFLFLNLYMKCVLLTSAPRRLSEHILQKDNKACWKAGDNFLRHHKKQKTKNSHYSLQHLICTPQVLWRMS